MFCFFRVISDAISRHLFEKESGTPLGVAFRGVRVADAVNYILDTTDVIQYTSFKDDDEERTFKIVSKVIKHMIDKDGTIAVVQGEGAKGVSRTASGRLLEQSARLMDMGSMAAMNSSIHIMDSFMLGEEGPSLYKSSAAAAFEQLYIALSVCQLPQEASMATLAKPTPKQSKYQLAPLAQADTASRRSKPSRVKVSSKGYKILSDLVLSYLHSIEENWRGSDVFPGVSAKDTVDWVLKECGSSLSEYHEDHVDEEDSRKYMKLVFKIVSRMVHVDGTVQMLGEADNVERGAQKRPPYYSTLIRAANR